MGQRRCVVACRRTDAGRFRRSMACGALAPGIQCGLAFLSASVRSRRWQPTASCVAGGSRLGGRPWGTCAPAWAMGGSGQAAGRGQARVETSDRGCSATLAPGPAIAELAPLLRAAGYVPVCTGAAEPSDWQRRQGVAGWWPAAPSSVGQLRGGGLAMAGHRHPNNSRTRRFRPCRCQSPGPFQTSFDQPPERFAGRRCGSYLPPHTASPGQGVAGLLVDPAARTPLGRIGRRRMGRGWRQERLARVLERELLDSEPARGAGPTDCDDGVLISP